MSQDAVAARPFILTIQGDMYEYNYLYMCVTVHVKATRYVNIIYDTHIQYTARRQYRINDFNLYFLQ